ncbi:MAG: epimerase [Sphingomonas sp. 28-66-16]|nr:MAG: epimerase [Sphingomonas sp. 28-66-16]
MTKRIVVTGAGGFVGQALLRALGPDHDVLAIDHRLNGHAGLEGDLGDPALLAAAFSKRCEAVVHLATVPGGAAEADPARAKQVNVDAAMALIDAAAQAGRCPRFVFASSIAVFGDPLPPLVDDATPIAPTMVYGAHKAMMEQWIATQTRRGAISGVSLRLPGIVARPLGPSGMKSAFISNLFHALHARTPIVLPVSPGATLWLMSVTRCAANIVHALGIEATGSVTLPALRSAMGDLVSAIARATGCGPGLVDYAPDAAIEAVFGRQPPLSTPRADALGFTDDDAIDSLVASALSTLA